MMELIYILIGLYLLYTLVNFKTEHGFVYAKYPWAHRNVWGSLPNPKEIKRGYMWTTISKLKKTFQKSDKNIVFFNYFRFDENYKLKSKMSSYFAKKAENTALYFNPLKMTEGGILIIGKQGGGKTEGYVNILKQPFYNRAVIHQVKAGDFVEIFLTKNDILFSLFDKRGYCWDALCEDEGIVKTFFENISNASAGDKKDFFSASAQKLYNEIAQKTRIQCKNESSSVRWLHFIKNVKDLFAEMDSGSQKSKQDVKSTMEIVFPLLEILAFRMQDPKQPRFVIKDFFARKKQCKLILDNIQEHEKTLTPLFSAFVACMSQIHTSMPNSKTDFTLYALDEYLSFLKIMEESAKTRLHTLIRSKGGIMMPAVQYMPADEDLKKLLTSSAYAWVYYSTIEDKTLDIIKNAISKVQYAYTEENESKDSKGDKSKSYSTRHEDAELISNDLLTGLADKHEHIVFLPNHNILYKGYTPQANLKKRAEGSIPSNLDDFYAIKYKTDKPMENLQDLTFADLFKEKPLSKIDEWKLYKKFEKAKKEGANLDEFKKTENLQAVNLELLFEKYMLNETVLKNKMKMFTVDERFELKKEWDKIEDDASQIEFIEQHGLYGALPAFFEFESPEERLELEEWS